MRVFRLHPKAALFVVGLVTGLLATSGDPGIDTLKRLQVTHSIWTGEPPVKPGDYPGFGIPGRDGVIHAWYGIGQSIAMLPADVVSSLALRALPLTRAARERVRPVLVCLLTFPFLAALILVSSFVLLQRVGFTNEVAALGSLGLQFATGHLAYTQSHQENSLLLLLAVSGLALVAGGKKERFGGVLLGMQLSASAILVRLTAALDLLAVTIFAVATCRIQAEGSERGTRVRNVLAAALGSVALYVALDRAYEWLRFGDLTSTYIHLYGKQARLLNPRLPQQYPFTTPFLDGFLGPFLSPQRSILLLEPLIFVTVGIVATRWTRLDLRVKALFGALGFLVVAQVGFYATYFDWSGASAWGDRFITVPVHLLAALGLATVVQQWPSIGAGWRRMTIGVSVAAVVVQLASIALWYNLEEAQAAHWHHPVFMPWQRFVNLAAAISGRFEDWGLSYPGFTQRSLLPNFLPFLMARHLSPGLAYLVETVWGVSVGGLVIAIMSGAQSLLRSQNEEPVETH